MNAKIGGLANSISALKLKPPNEISTPLKSIDCQNIDDVDWKKINNIADLTQEIPSIRFYRGDAAKKSPSILRCETCYSLLQHRYSGKISNCIVKVALQGIGKYAGSLSSGLVLSPEKSEFLVKGGNPYWYHSKRNIKQHLVCAGDHSQLHFESLQHDMALKKREARGLKVVNNLIRIALSVLKSKSAAQHFESEIAAHVSTGRDLGDLGHSRNHFNEILSAMQVWVDRQSGSFLAKPLQSTGFPPHFFITADKSTPQRITNQAIMICPVVNGKRVAIPVDSPKVYSSKDRATVGTVSGANADELAKQVISSIKKAFGSNMEFELRSSWQGTSCDGQYQATEFGATLHKELNVKADPEFSAVIWDPSHWLNLAILDIRDDKIGQSGNFLRNFVNRSKNIHAMFNRGKMLCSAIAIAQSKGVKLKMTQRNCATRFWSSQYRQFLNIIDGFGVYAEAFREFGYSELKEYEILGKDFVVDLCIVTDVMAIIMELMVRVQSLAQPCWKICCWSPKVKSFLQSLKDEDIENPSQSLKNLSEHIENITTDSTFKGQPLVDGWKIIAHDDNVDTWLVRDVCDCKNDFQIFVGDMINSLDARYNTCVADMCTSLLCLDFETIITLLCGSRQNGKPVLNEVKLEEFGKDGFKRFIEYVCRQDHIQTAIKDGVLELEPGLSHVLHRKLKQVLKEIIWEKKDLMVKWFSVIKKKPVALAVDLPASTRTLQTFTLLPNPSALDDQFSMTFSGSDKKYQVEIDESAIIRSIYTDEDVFNMLGKELCLIIDIALVKGGPEAVVESYYSVVKSQQQPGGQSNQNLSLRAKLDWCLPNILQSDTMVKEVSKLYIQGCKDMGLKKHALPIIGDGSPYRNSKVLDRVEDSDARLPFLL